MQATEALKKVQTDVERIRNDETQRFPAAATDGDAVRQGDVYLTYRESLPAGLARVKKPQAQLAPGNTQGSRHILDSLDGVTMYDVDGGTVLDGPVMETTKERTVTHPEHGNFVIPPGVYEVTYQRAYAEELRRVAD